MVEMGVYDEKQREYDKKDFESLLSNIPAGVIIENESFEIEYMNEFMTRIFGNRVGKKCYELFAGRNNPCNPCPVDTIVKQGTGIFRYTTAGRDGGFYEIIASPLHHPDGSLSIIEIVRDITEQQKLDQMKNDFIHVVAHEMRTPLAAVIGFGDLLSLRSENLTDKQKYYIESIKNNSYKLKQLIDDLLDLSYLDAGMLKLEYDSVHLYEIVSEVLARRQLLIAEKNHEIDINISPALIIECDRQRITRVMENIIFNAIYYTDIDGKIRITAADHGDHILVSVSDNGIGISETDLPRIFDRFYMVDSSLTRHCDRIGVGLTMAKGYIELHGGEMWADSEIGMGSTFYFTLPKCKMNDDKHDCCRRDPCM